MIIQQIIGISRLSLPVIVLFNFFPWFAQSSLAIIACSCAVALYVWYINWKQLNHLVTSLQYAPTSEDKNAFERLIKECAIDPDSIQLRYAYTAQQIAMAAKQTLIIDPTVWHIEYRDPQAAMVGDIYTTHVKPHMSPTQHVYQEKFKNLLNPAVQRFIFKHELGHIQSNFSYKKLYVIFLTAFFTTYTAIMAAVCALSYGGIVAVAAGMVTGFFSDFLYTYASNALWKVKQEKDADAFAARYSTPEEIKAAALFFEQHQEVIDTHKDTSIVFGLFPSELTTGHPQGKPRSAVLRRVAQKKEKNNSPF